MKNLMIMMMMMAWMIRVKMMKEMRLEGDAMFGAQCRPRRGACT